MLPTAVLGVPLEGAAVVAALGLGLALLLVKVGVDDVCLAQVGAPDEGTV